VKVYVGVAVEDRMPRATIFTTRPRPLLLYAQKSGGRWAMGPMPAVSLIATSVVKVVLAVPEVVLA